MYYLTTGIPAHSTSQSGSVRVLLGLVEVCRYIAVCISGGIGGDFSRQFSVQNVLMLFSDGLLPPLLWWPIVLLPLVLPRMLRLILDAQFSGKPNSILLPPPRASTRMAGMQAAQAARNASNSVSVSKARRKFICCIPSETMIENRTKATTMDMSERTSSRSIALRWVFPRARLRWRKIT